MKKSKFLQSSKDVLHRSFNPAKCKTSLKLAGSRLKLLRNKKEVQVKQMKREIAQLLESGQDQTARIRVEHVIREEKMMAAYDLIEIYCELIVARLPIIESQKNCPIDLKEAIASLIFASPRCGDIPELLDARKHFTTKYGKDFTTAALEVRPQCGVSRLLIEKLSAAAPDGPTKIKILSAIAEEHNVQWEPKSFDEKTSTPSDLLNGPSTFDNQSKPYIETPTVQAPTGYYSMQSSPINVSEQDPRTSVETEKLPSAETSSVSSSFQPEARPPGNEREHVYHTNGNKHRWSMDFKDATSAAQAAAESAERASIAARAAAELSSYGRISGQYSGESNKSDAYSPKDGGFERHASGNFARGGLSEETSNRSSHNHSKLHYEQRNEIKQDNQKTSGSFKDDGRGSRMDYGHSVSLKSKDSDSYVYSHDPLLVDERTSKNSFKDFSKGDMDERTSKNSFKDFSKGDTNIHRDSFKYEDDGANARMDKSENPTEDRIQKQPSYKSSRSASSVFDDVNVFASSEGQKLEIGADLGHFVEDASHGEASTASFHEPATSFDKSDSEIDDRGFDMGVKYDEQDLEFHMRSYGQTSPDHMASSTDSWPPKFSSNKTSNFSPSPFFARMNSPPDVSENVSSKDVSEPEHSGPITFDASDGPSSESDEDTDLHRHPVAEDSEDRASNPNKFGQSARSGLKDKSSQPVGETLKGRGYSGSERKQYPLSSDDELNYEDRLKDRNQGKSFNTGSSERFTSGKSSAVRYDDSRMESNDARDESNFGDYEGLNFGKVTGGLRHKGPTQLPYLKNRSDAPSSFKKESGSPSTIAKATVRPAVEDPKITEVSDRKKSSKTSYHYSESDSDSFENETLQKVVVHKQEMDTPRRKGYTQPPYLKNQSDALSSFKKETGSPATIAKSTIRHAVKDSKVSDHKKGSKTSYHYSESDSDSSEDETSGTVLGHKQEVDTLRHQGHSQPPYLKNRSDAASSFKKETGSNAMIAKSTVRPTVEDPMMTTVSDRKKSSEISYHYSESDSDNSGDETAGKVLDRKPKVDTPGTRKEVETKSSLRGSNSMFGSDNSDFDESPKELLARNSHRRGGISRRTKPSPVGSGTISNSKMQFKSGTLDDPDYGMDKKTAYVSETPIKLDSQRRNSNKGESDERPTSGNVSSRPDRSSIWGPPDQHNAPKATSVTLPESTSWHRSETRDSDDETRRKHSDAISSATKQDFQSSKRNSSQLGGSEQRHPAKVESKPKSSLWGPPEKSDSGKTGSVKIQESKVFRDSVVAEEVSSSMERGESARSENSKPETVNKTTSASDDSNKKPSHVHPKLPDYDTLFQSLRLGRS